MPAGKLRVARKATKGKGKKWKKGSSSSSNPETKKYREQAKRGFFHKQGEGNLTEELLAQHDAHQGVEDLENDDEIDDSQSIGGKTFKTFASDWSNCTNPSFNRLMKNWQSNSAQHKEMLAVVAAVTEVIKEKNGKESETEYFGALMTTLESVGSEESRAAVVTLLGMVMKRLPPSVLKLKFSPVSKVFVGLLTSGTEHPSALRSLIGCQSILLRVQEPAVWGHSSTLQIYGVLLSFVINPKPKVRKAAQHAVISILTNSVIMTLPKPPPYHPAASMTSKFCCQKIEECGGSGNATTITLHVLGLLKSVLNSFSKSDLKTTCETVIRVMTLGNPIVTCCSLQVFVGLFSTKASENLLTAELAAQLINALYDYQPNANDIQPQKAWLLVMKCALIYLHKLDSNLCLGHLVKFIGIAVKCWLSDKLEIVAESTLSVETLLEVTFGQNSIEDTKKNASQLAKIIQLIEGCLKYQYNSAWDHVLRIVSVLIKVSGKSNAPLFVTLLRTISDMRETHKFLYTSQVDRAFAVAVKVFGPQIVLQAVPFKINELDDRIDFPKSWLIPLIRDNVKETELQFFVKYFLPLSERLQKKISQLNQADRKIEAKTCEILFSQIWSLLPGFCNMPTDLTESFKSIAQNLGIALTKSPDLRLYILSALRILIKKNLNNESNKTELARFAKNYLPILFNLYTTEPKETFDNSVRLAVYDTIKIYLKITDEERVGTLFKIAFDQLRGSKIETFKRHALLDLTRALLPYINTNSISSLFNHATPLLEHEDKTIQKKAYRVMEELCQAQSEGCLLFVKEHLKELQKLFINSISKAIPSSKAPRLRCLASIVSQLEEPNDEFVAEVVPEAVLCTKENAEKARLAAFKLLVDMGKAKQRWSKDSPNDSFTEYIQVIIAGLAGTPYIISATVLALGRIFYEFKDSMSRDLIDALIENMCLLMTSKSREIIQSVLSFFKTLLGCVSPDYLLQYIPNIVKSLTEISNETHRYFRFKSKEIFTRLVRLYGYESISKMVPSSHEKMLTHIKKSEARKKRDKESSNGDGDSEDGSQIKKVSDDIEDILEDSDAPMSDDDEKSMKRPRKTAKRRRNEAWIEETGDEIVDFLDPTVNRKVTATKPNAGTQKKSIKHDFKMAPDGRLIITEDDDEKPIKRNPGDLGDITEAVETMSLKGVKRERGHDSDDDEDDNQTRASFKGSGKGIRRDINKPQIHDGKKFKAKKAQGDIKKAGQVDPYAYIPLDRQALNRRKKAKFDKHFATVVKSAKKGARKGAKQKRLNRR